MKVYPIHFVKFFCKAFIPLPKGGNGLIRQFYVVLDNREELGNLENDSRVKTRFVIRPLTVKEYF